MYVMGMNAFFVFAELVIKAKRIEKNTHTNISVGIFTPKVVAQHNEIDGTHSTQTARAMNNDSNIYTQHKRYYLALKSHKERKTRICNVCLWKTEKTGSCMS